MQAEQVNLRALIVSYAFPPTGGAGVARPLKLAKFLPEFGITPAVLTASNPSVPLRDESLLTDVAPQLEIVTAPTLRTRLRSQEGGLASRRAGAETRHRRPAQIGWCQRGEGDARAGRPGVVAARCSSRAEQAPRAGCRRRRVDHRATVLVVSARAPRASSRNRRRARLSRRVEDAARNLRDERPRHCQGLGRRSSGACCAVQMR